MQEVLYSALSAVFNLTCATVPVLPLLGKKWSVEPGFGKNLESPLFKRKFVNHQALGMPRFPELPVKLGGVGVLHGASLNESRPSCHRLGRRAGNSGFRL
jgi:hypothetical protein